MSNTFYTAVAICYVVLGPILGGLMAGADRKISAGMQGRQGPPLLQPFYDVIKLLSKETVSVNKVQICYFAAYLFFIVTTGVLFFADYDLLAESGLLPQIIAEFKESYDECDVLLKMALAMELEDNNVNVLFGKFLNSILQRVDDVMEFAKNTFGNIDIKDILGEAFKEEDLAELKGFLDKYNNK